MTQENIRKAGVEALLNPRSESIGWRLAFAVALCVAIALLCATAFGAETTAAAWQHARP